MIHTKLDFICGDFFEKQSNISFGGNTPSYPLNNGISIDLKPIYESILTPYVYVNSDRVDELFNMIRTYGFNREFYLITHNGDRTFNNEMDIPSCVIKWYGQNINHYDDKVQSIPIGLERNAWFPYKRDILVNTPYQNKNNLLYFNCNLNTNYGKRKHAYDVLSHNGITLIKGGLGYDEYIRDISGSYFVVSPDGNGIDCHRTWEVLYSNSVPILIDSPSHRMCYANLPVLLIPSWDVLTSEYLESKIDIFYTNGILNEGYKVKANNFLLRGYENK